MAKKRNTSVADVMDSILGIEKGPVNYAFEKETAPAVEEPAHQVEEPKAEQPPAPVEPHVEEPPVQAEPEEENMEAPAIPSEPVQENAAEDAPAGTESDDARSEYQDTATAQETAQTAPEGKDADRPKRTNRSGAGRPKKERAIRQEQTTIFLDEDVNKALTLHVTRKLAENRSVYVNEVLRASLEKELKLLQMMDEL